MASEEQISRELDKKGILIVDYEFFPLHSTTVKQYKDSGIIEKRSYGKYEKRKADGLLVDRRDKKKPKVLLVIEWKKPSGFQTDKQKKESIEQCNDVCQLLDASIGVITDGIVTYWINPRQDDAKNDYRDRTTDEKRSYSFILSEDKQKVQTNFFIKEQKQLNYEKLEETTKETYDLIQKILDQISEQNSTFRKTKEVDPLNLAKSVWQDIYVNTGKDPTKCLYNVVELFIFKFLSDLNVLKTPYDFQSLMDMYKNKKTSKEVLEFYARNSRVEIIKLFPIADDGTTIINGTIFVDGKGKPVYSQANLFKSSLQKYAEFQSLRNIKKEFKTKLFETFLKQSQDKSRLGQFFTPRKVVRAIIEMADVNSAEFICDPFCGVGGFILEPLQTYPKLKSQFRSNFSSKRVKFLGYDKGSDDDEHRTIILAKANMLIYLSDIVQKAPNLTKNYAEYFNGTFKLLSESNLGTLKVKFKQERDKPDLILSNPPYVKKGSRSLRNEIKEEGLESEYKCSGVGVEGLALKWILNNLRKDGRAFVVIPNGIMDNFANKKLREEIKKECFINAIISLPMKTFFNTNKKTYILCVEKKQNNVDIQDFPIFCYLVSSIGENLDADRFEIEDNDLEQAKNLYNQFKGSKTFFKVDDPRCKLIDFNVFDKSKYWIIENFWKDKELINLKIKEEKKTLGICSYNEFLSDLEKEINSSRKKIKKIEDEISKVKFKDKKITELFDIELGKAKYTKEYINNHQGEYPVYSAQTLNNGEIGKIDHYDWDAEGLTWSIDGSYPGMVFYRKGKFNMTCHSGLLLIKEEHKKELDYKYLLYLLNNHLPDFIQGQGNKRLKKTHIEEDVKNIKIPITSTGKFDLAKQKEIANKYEVIETVKKKLKEAYKRLSEYGVIIK
ncbi:N-6 DNA methylase [bacterium]|nr:N-6 DNA methylase [bacterium]